MPDNSELDSILKEIDDSVTSVINKMSKVLTKRYKDKYFVVIRKGKHLYHGKITEVKAYQSTQKTISYIYSGIYVSYINRKGKECSKMFISGWYYDLRFFDTEENAMLFCEINNIGG